MCIRELCRLLRTVFAAAAVVPFHLFQARTAYRKVAIAHAFAAVLELAFFAPAAAVPVRRRVAAIASRFSRSAHLASPVHALVAPLAIRRSVARIGVFADPQQARFPRRAEAALAAINALAVFAKPCFALVVRSADFFSARRFHRLDVKVRVAQFGRLGLRGQRKQAQQQYEDDLSHGSPSLIRAAADAVARVIRNRFQRVFASRSGQAFFLFFVVSVAFVAFDFRASRARSVAVAGFGFAVDALAVFNLDGVGTSYASR